MRWEAVEKKGGPAAHVQRCPQNECIHNQPIPSPWRTHLGIGVEEDACVPCPCDRCTLMWMPESRHVGRLHGPVCPHRPCAEPPTPARTCKHSNPFHTLTRVQVFELLAEQLVLALLKRLRRLYGKGATTFVSLTPPGDHNPRLPEHPRPAARQRTPPTRALTSGCSRAAAKPSVSGVTCGCGPGPPNGSCTPPDSSSSRYCANQNQ